MITNVRAILFDLDDTLFDRSKAQNEILRIIVRQMPEVFGRMDHERIAEAFAESDRLTCEEYEAGSLAEDFRARRGKLFLGMLDSSEAHERKITELYVNLYPTVEAPVDGAQDMVRRLAGLFRLGLVTNGLRDVQYRKLEALGIDYLFQCVVLSEALGVAKPDPQIFLHAATLLDTQPAHCLSVGDLHDADVVGAKGAGMKACWFNPRGLPAPRSAVQADAEIRSLRELPGLLGIS